MARVIAWLSLSGLDSAASASSAWKVFGSVLCGAVHPRAMTVY
jgi:hypothetical protein